MLSNMPFETLALVFIAFSLGGILKGATGAGAPFLAVPIMAILVDVQFAVAVFVFPNVFSNAWQIWRYRRDGPSARFSVSFAIAGVIGACIGTFALAAVDGAILSKTIAIVVFVYVGFRLLNPGWALSWTLANRIVVPVGVIGGFFQGAIGLSAPVSVTFMNAVGLDRKPFIFTMSLFFFTMALVQFPTQIALGVMSYERFGYSLLAVIPLLLGMPLGDALGRRISKATFDKVIIMVLTLLAIRLLF